MLSSLPRKVQHGRDHGMLKLILLWTVCTQLQSAGITGTCESRGVLKFGFGRDVPPGKLKVHPYKYQFFKKTWPIHIPICSILGQIFEEKLPDFSKNFLEIQQILAEIWKNFEKSMHLYTKFVHFIRVIHIPRGWFWYPYWRHIPVRSFVLSTTPRVVNALKVKFQTKFQALIWH